MKSAINFIKWKGHRVGLCLTALFILSALLTQTNAFALPPKGYSKSLVLKMGPGRVHILNGRTRNKRWHKAPVLPTKSETFSNDEIRPVVPAQIQNRKVLIEQSYNKNTPAKSLYRTLATVAASKANLSADVHVLLSSTYAKRFDRRFLKAMANGVHSDGLSFGDGKRVITPKAPKRHAVRKKTPLLWGDGSHPELLAMLGGKMGVKPQTLKGRKSLKNARVLPENPKGRRVYILNSKEVGDSEQMHFDILKSLYAAWQAKRKGAGEVVMVMPYLPYSRSDRMDTRGTAVGAAIPPALAKAAGVDKVVFYSVHQAQEVGIFQALGIKALHASGEAVLAPTIARQLKNSISKGKIRMKQIKVVSPDQGATKRARVFAKELAKNLGVEKVEVLEASKERTGRNGEKVKTYFKEDVKDAVLIAIDDESASGGTQAQLADAAKAQGARQFHGVVAHLTGPAAKAITSKSLDKIYALDTLSLGSAKLPAGKVVRIPLAGSLAKLLRASEGRGDTGINDMLFFEH